MRILLIAPYVGLIKAFEEAVYRRGHMMLETYECDTVNAPGLIRNLDLDNYDVIISRGYTCNIIQAECERQVLDVGISIYDALRAIRLALDYKGRTAIVGFPSVIQYAVSLTAMMQYPIDIYTLQSIEEIEPRLRSLKEDGYTMVIGDVITTTIAKLVELQSILITTSPESVETVLDNAEALFQERISLRRRKAFLKNVLANTSDLIAVYRADGACDLSSAPVSPEMHRALQRACGSVMEKKTLRSVKTVGDTRYVLNGRMMISENETYAVFTVRELNQINRENEFIFYRNVDDEPSVSQRLFFTLTPSVQGVLGALRSFQFFSRPVVISGERGSGKDQFAMYLYRESSRRNMPIAVIDCRYAKDSVWDGFINREDSPLYSNGCVLYFKNLHLLTGTQQEQLLSMIKYVNLHKRNQLIFSYTPSISPAFERGALLEELVNILQALTVRIPPIRERREDIPNFATLYLNEFNAQLARQVVAFDADALKRMQAYDWPDNLYQMRKVIQELILNAVSPIVTEREVRLALERSDREVRASSSAASAARLLCLEGTLEDITRRVIRQVLEEENMNQSKAARRLSIGRSTLRRHMEVNPMRRHMEENPPS